MTGNTSKEHKNPKVDNELQKLVNEASSHLTEKQRHQVTNCLQQYKSLFALSDNDLGCTSIVRHRINTGTNYPVKQPPRRTPVAMRDEIDKHIDNMLERGVIEPSEGPWSSGIVLVKKKDGSTRFCVDYRRLNDLTVKDAYPLPRIDDSLEQLAGNKWFSTLNLCSGYWQVEVEESDRPKTAFATRRGLFQFRKMPFGLACAPATFERLMERVMAGLQWNICLVYLDDIIVVGRNFEEMLTNLRQVSDRLIDAGLKLNPKSIRCSQNQCPSLDM
ncbi:Transposon Ty3-G Gag-Pol polyprotein,Transposon Ty3-I Gag-Pol polyprotein [Mytilus edulis]|uniref:Transposon Ty3-G Gag-Pol polyprotein,Transposon Ty3-I Gag-Pol polyprotein n=1 Tax=Mytilus edulis TaxID=6550 RepID=A0A8S3UWI1_MYTED|nr:Transposon Ty3-G Gag-Pol polyprotein,Transposon Ty3-I Gag-Pol polyprotein [Mytilus edulis]